MNPSAAAILAGTPTLVIVMGVVLAAVVVLVVFAFARMGWRLVRGNEQPDAGGSWGDQLTRRGKRR
jgi:hypothetical protein